VSTLYERAGGRAWFESVVKRFYEGVAEDPVLRPLYPDDLGPPAEHLANFLIQYWGGPTDYSDTRGHPRLRMRHFPFSIGMRERDAWFKQMSAAVKAEAGLEPEDEAKVLEYLGSTATFLINQR
jgi:hemoglobin